MSTLLLLFSVLFVCLGLRHLGRRLYRNKVAELTCNAEVTQLAASRSEAKKIPGTAVICGGSVAGLITARVCHDHFARVIIVEREGWLNTEDGRVVEAWTQKNRRAHVMQYYSLHAIHALLFEICKRLFPDYQEQCSASSIPIQFGSYSTSNYGHPLRVVKSMPKTIFTSRQGFETLLRRLVLDKSRYPNIEQVIGTVAAINPDEKNGSRVASISVKDREGKTVSIEGQCFIDCTGSFQGLQWLDKAGYGQLGSQDQKTLPLNKLKTSYDPKLRYSTMEFPTSPDLIKRMDIPDDGRVTIYSNLTHPWKNNESIYIHRRDGGFIQLCAGGWGGQETPSNLEDFIKFGDSQYLEKPHPDYYYRCLDMLREIEDEMKCSKVVVSPRSYIRYHMASNLPKNWIAIGDSVMTLNPAYGQGCSKAAIGATCLNAILQSLLEAKDLPDDFARRFFQLQHQKTVAMWDENRTGDYGHKRCVPVEGESLSFGAFGRQFGRRLVRLAFKDDEVAHTLFQVINLFAPGLDLMQPKILLKILWDVILHPSV